MTFCNSEVAKAIDRDSRHAKLMQEKALVVREKSIIHPGHWPKFQQIWAERISTGVIRSSINYTPSTTLNFH